MTVVTTGRRRDEEPPRWHPKRLADPTARCPQHPRKEWRPIIEKMWEQGWWVKRGGANHFVCYPPDDGKMITLPCSPSSRYTLGRKIAQARRAGLRI